MKYSRLFSTSGLYDPQNPQGLRPMSVSGFLRFTCFWRYS